MTKKHDPLDLDLASIEFDLGVLDALDFDLNKLDLLDI